MANLRVCRNPGCYVVFDPYWRVKLTGEPAETENFCPRCGADLDRNLHIRRLKDEAPPALREED